MSSNRDDSSVDYSTTDNLRAKRAKQACVNCKLHKVKCDGTVTEPCTQCIKKRIECVHSPPLKRGRKLKTEPTGEISMRQAPMLAPRNWYETAPNATHFQSRIQMFLDISQFYPFFRFQADGKIAADIWNTLYSRSLQTALVNVNDQVLLLSYVEHALVFGYGCHLMNSFEDSMHFYRLEEELFNSLQANNWNVGIHFVSRLVGSLLMKIDFESTVLKIFKNVANIFSLAYDIAKANEEFINPNTIYRVLSIPLLSPSQDITWSLQVLSAFDEEASHNPGNLTVLIHFFVSRYFDPLQKGEYAEIGKEIADIKILKGLLDLTNSILAKNKEKRILPPECLTQFECCLTIANAAFHAGIASSLSEVLQNVNHFLLLVQRLSVISYFVKNCFVIAHRICIFHKKLELAAKVVSIAQNFNLSYLFAPSTTTTTTTATETIPTTPNQTTNIGDEPLSTPATVAVPTPKVEPLQHEQENLQKDPKTPSHANAPRTEDNLGRAKEVDFIPFTPLKSPFSLHQPPFHQPPFSSPPHSFPHAPTPHTPFHTPSHSLPFGPHFRSYADSHPRMQGILSQTLLQSQPSHVKQQPPMINDLQMPPQNAMKRPLLQESPKSTATHLRPAVIHSSGPSELSISQPISSTPVDNIISHSLATTTPIITTTDHISNNINNNTNNNTNNNINNNYINNINNHLNDIFNYDLNSSTYSIHPLNFNHPGLISYHASPNLLNNNNNINNSIESKLHYHYHHYQQEDFSNKKQKVKHGDVKQTSIESLEYASEEFSKSLEESRKSILKQSAFPKPHQASPNWWTTSPTQEPEITRKRAVRTEEEEEEEEAILILELTRSPQI